MKKLIIVGFSPAYLPIISERAEALFSCKTFDVIHNLKSEDPKYSYQLDGNRYNHFWHEDYDFELNKNIPVCFGSLHSHIKYVLFHFFKKHYDIGRERYANLMDKISSLSRTTEYENGLGIAPMVSVYPFCKMGFGVNVKRNSTIGEHTIIGDFVSINPGVTLSGFVTIGEGTEISTGTSSVHDITIGKHCLIGAGSVITKDIPDGVVAYGNPCKVIRKNERWENIK